MKTDLELRHLRVFLSVVETGAHTRAARTLGLSQSTVSETLTALERALGTPLFRKTTKGPMLTPSGEALLPYARRMLALTAELKTDLSRVSNTVTATLLIAAVESLGTYVLPSRLAALRERWPNARIEVITAVCAEIRENVAAGKCDVGLVLETETRADAETVLSTARLVILASPSHPLANRRASPEHLRRCDFYTSDTAGNYHQALRHYFDDAQMPLPRTHAMGTIEGVKRGILADGNALGLLPAHAVTQELAQGALAEVKVSPALRGVVLRAVLSPTGAQSPLVAELIQGLRNTPLGV